VCRFESCSRHFGKLPIIARNAIISRRLQQEKTPLNPLDLCRIAGSLAQTVAGKSSKVVTRPGPAAHEMNRNHDSLYSTRSANSPSFSSHAAMAIREIILNPLKIDPTNTHSHPKKRRCVIFDLI
jgi:hypothetical protein